MLAISVRQCFLSIFAKQFCKDNPYIEVEPEPADVGVVFAQGVGADAWGGGGGGSQDQVGVVFAATLAAAQDNQMD